MKRLICFFKGHIHGGKWVFAVNRFPIRLLPQCIRCGKPISPKN